MRYCTKCGQKIVDGAAFCVSCGEQVETDNNFNAAHHVFEENLDREAYEFLETTHRLLRWEQKAWSIASKVFIIIGIIYAAFGMLFSLFGITAILISENIGGIVLFVFFFLYSVIIGGTIIGTGIVSKKASEKLPQYIDTVYTDFSLTYNRCGSVGMLVFTIIFGAVSPVFFIINFVRMKSNRAVVERIIQNQNAQRQSF